MNHSTDASMSSRFRFPETPETNIRDQIEGADKAVQAAHRSIQRIMFMEGEMTYVNA